MYNNVIVSRETIDLLNHYERLVVKWNKALNLISKNTIDNFKERHISDALQLCNYITPNHNTIVDFGSGGGIPVIILAIANQQKHFIAMESDSRKCVFLRKAALDLGLQNIEVINDRIESTDKIEADLCISRACAPLDLLLSFTVLHGGNKPEALFLKGKTLHNEITLAKNFDFQYSTYASQTNQDAYIIKIDQIRQK